MAKFAKKAVLIGAGNIGKGYLADLFESAGYSLTFLTHSLKQAERLRERGSYTIYKTAEDSGQVQKICISGFDAYSTSAEREECIRALCETNYATVHLYPAAFEDVANLLAEPSARERHFARKRRWMFFCASILSARRSFLKMSYAGS